MQKISAANWIYAARSCAPIQAPNPSAMLAALAQRRNADPTDRSLLPR